jgi:hypothetical protein
LLGALAQAAIAQQAALHGKLVDERGGLGELQRRLYENDGRETLEEVVVHPVLYTGHAPGSKPIRVELIDCNGTAAIDVLTRRRSLTGEPADGKLSAALLRADAIVLVIDAATPAARMESDFEKFGQFLRLFQLSRGRRGDVGGLPVFLVLTKCDLLVTAGDSAPMWLDRVEERKRQVGHRFADFLAHSERGGKLPFGSLDLHIWAVAASRPALDGQPARSHDPHGVAELFRQAIELAQAYRRRDRDAGLRLAWTSMAAAFLVAALGALVGFFLLHRDDAQPSPLQGRVQRALNRDLAQAHARFHSVQQKIEEYAAYVDDEAFAKLPEEMRRAVQRRLDELRAFRDFEKQLDALPPPRELDKERALLDLKEQLAALKALPNWDPDWYATEAGRKLRERIDEADALAKAVEAVRAGYEKVLQDGRRELANSNERNLPLRAKRVLDEAKLLPDPRTDMEKPIPGAEQVPYSVVFDFDVVREVVRPWAGERLIRDQLEHAASLLKP